MIPDESPEVEIVETTPLVPVDIFVEAEAGAVHLTFGADDREDDLTLALTPSKARELGDLLFRVACSIP